MPDHVRIHVPEVLVKIEGTKIRDGNDDVVWAPIKNGQYTLREMYELIRSSKTPWEWSLVWVKAKIPRHAFILWMALKGGLKTIQKLKARGVVNSDICVLCWNCVETEQHIFYDCAIFKQVQRQLKQTMGYGRRTLQTWRKELEGLISVHTSCAIQRDGPKLVFSAVIY